MDLDYIRKLAGVVSTREAFTEALTKTELLDILSADATQKEAFEQFLKAMARYQQDSEEYYKDLVVTTYRKLHPDIKAGIAAPRPKLKILYRGDDGKSQYSCTSWSTSPRYTKSFGTYIYPLSALAGFEATIDTERLQKLLDVKLSSMRFLRDYARLIGSGEEEVIVIGQKWKNNDPEQDAIYVRDSKPLPADVEAAHDARIQKRQDDYKKMWARKDAEREKRRAKSAAVKAQAAGVTSTPTEATQMSIAARMRDLLEADDSKAPVLKLKDVRAAFQAIADMATERYNTAIRAKTRLTDKEKEKLIRDHLPTKITVSQDKDVLTGSVYLYKVGFDSYPDDAQKQAMQDWAQKNNLRMSKNADIAGSRWKPIWVYAFHTDD